MHRQRSKDAEGESITQSCCLVDSSTQSRAP